MKDRKYELNRFSIYDSTAVQRHLEEMAAKGWMIRKLGMYLCQYERIEPRQLHFAVVCLPKASPYDPVPTPGQQLLEEYATADGWKLEAQQDAMLLFSNDRPDPVPMETDRFPEPTQYIPQVAAYAATLERMTGKKVARRLLYFFADGSTHEV